MNSLVSLGLLLEEMRLRYQKETDSEILKKVTTKMFYVQ